MPMPWRGAVAGLLLAIVPYMAEAGVVITGTRVVYPASEREVSVKLNNDGAGPVLVQAWIDDGDADMKAQERAMPFTLLPPVSRIDPGNGQTLRMRYLGQALPQDRESVFYLNVLEIPPRPDGATPARAENFLQVAFRTRIKIFFRPTGLPGSADDAPGQVAWRIVPEGDGLVLRADNPTPYAVNIAGVLVRAEDGRDYPGRDGGMIPPGASLSFPLPGLREQPAAPQILYTAISDHGAYRQFTPGGKPYMEPAGANR